MHKLLGLYKNNSKASANVWHTVTFLQVISPDDVILRCLFDFSGQEGDELTIQANQVSGLCYNRPIKLWITGKEKVRYCQRTPEENLF